MTTVDIRPARPDELAVVEALLTEASAWLASRGIDQWQYPPHRDRLTRAIRRGECFLAVRHGKPVATMRLDDHADPEFWSDADQPDTALYIHQMAVARTAAGQGIGAAMLDWAADRAARAGKAWLRLDAWKTNPGLHAYYTGQGFALVRIVDLGHRFSGALFQRPVTAVVDPVHA